MESELLMRCGVDDRADDPRPCHLPLEFSTVFEHSVDERYAISTHDEEGWKEVEYFYLCTAVNRVAR